MKVTVDFEECLKDSPRFRAALEEVEGDVTELELKLDKLVKLCIAMIDTGKAFCLANKQFMNGIRDLAQYSCKDALVEANLTKFSDTLQEMINYHNILFDQTQRSIKAQLQTFKFKDAKKQFEKVSEEKENALVKNAQVQRNKQHEVEEATNILTATRKCFRHIALDYVLQINVLQSKRRSEILKSVRYDYSGDDTKLEYNVDAANGIVMEGYLFKRASNAFKTWNRKKPDHIRRWFSIQNNQLVYQKKFKINVVLTDLEACKQCFICCAFCYLVAEHTVTGDCFFLLFRSLGVHFSKVRSLTLDSWEPELLKLMCELGNDVINRIYEAKLEKVGVKKPQPGSQRQEKEAYIKAKYVERKFVEKQPAAAASPLESRTKALPQSREEKRHSAPEKSLLAVEQGAASPRVRSSDSGIQQSVDDSREHLASTISANSLYEPGVFGFVFQDEDLIFFLLAHSVKGKEKVYLLKGSTLSCTGMIWQFKYCSMLFGKQVCLFLKRGANQHATDEDGKDPLSIAVEAANADIVTLLRLARMNEEMRESEGLYGQPGDEIYQDIFRDFSQMASNNPEKLNRFQQSDSQKP
uniref:Arf-GAP with coiled-coil, ANK repeat and PH domain-containing protein n=1 Tax=Pavo cristatus TaxID=9049 RepID=A0A8C9FAV0_PAVCR